MSERGFHSGKHIWQRKERPCDRWWYGACVLEGRDDDKLSVPCAMFQMCLYGTHRDDLPDSVVEVLDAWAYSRVCLIGYSPLHAPDLNPEQVFGS